MTKVAGGEEVRSTMPSGGPDDPLMPLTRPPEGAALLETSVDVLMIGAGTAGLSGAIAACRAGAGVVVLDERTECGGQYCKPIASSHRVEQPPDRQILEGARLTDDAPRSGVRLLQGASVFGAFSLDEVLALVDGAAVLFRPRRLILATGAYERPMPTMGWTLTGVMTTGALQALTRSDQVVPGRRVVIAGVSSPPRTSPARSAAA